MTNRKTSRWLLRNVSLFAVAACLTTGTQNAAGQEVADSTPASDSVEKKNDATAGKAPSQPTLNTTQLVKLSENLAYIADDTKRLRILRNQLGIKISDQSYQAALKNYGYQVNGYQFYREINEAYFAGLSEEDLKASFHKDAQRSDLTEQVSIDPIVQLREQIAKSPYATNQKALRDRLNQELRKSKEITDEYQRKASTQVTLLDLARIAPKEALENYIELGPNNTEPYTLVEVIEKWATKDPDATLAWILSMTDYLKKEGSRHDKVNDLRGLLLTSVIPAWHLKNPNSEISKTALNLDLISSDHRKTIQIELLRHLAVFGDPAEALTKARKLEGYTSENAAKNIIKIWAITNPTQAAKWLGKLPKNDKFRKREYLVEVGFALGAIDFLAGEKLLRQIPDEENRSVIFFELAKQNWPDTHAIRLANEIPTFNPIAVIYWAVNLSADQNSKGASAFREWLKPALDAGKIKPLDSNQPFETFRKEFLKTIGDVLNKEAGTKEEAE